MSADLLFELGCEELPSKAVKLLSETLVELITAALNKAELGYKAIQPLATPRRIGFVITELAATQPRQTISRRGPALQAAYDANGQPTPALSGFAKSCGVEIEALQKLETEKGAWLVYEASKDGESTLELMPKMIEQALAALPIPKPMRWGNEDIEFVRPVHWAVLIYGDKPIAAKFLGVNTGSYTYGHRFHAPEPILIESIASYPKKLEQAKVLVNFAERRARIVAEINAVAARYQARAIMPDDLIDEVTSIVEWPQALAADFDPRFLEVPAEALIASMQSHQKCFALEDQEGHLLPHFITISNIESLNPKQVIAGNEKVMRARLSDADFFYQLDRKKPLADLLPATEQVIFEASLGSLEAKSERLGRLIQVLAKPLQLDSGLAARAALLSKADLLSGMVGEFPELQGLMGYYYALNDQEDLSVALALHEQYLPRFANDQLPQSDLGRALSLVDRLDTLAGIFAIGQKPTGVKDPYKLRRHALAVVRLLETMPNDLSLSMLVETALATLPPGLPAMNEGLAQELQDFILDRLQSHYLAQGYKLELFNAVKARQSDALIDFKQRIQALATFVDSPELLSLAASCKRVNNILAQAGVGQAGLDKALLLESAERDLVNQLELMEPQIRADHEQGRYSALLSALASLKPAVDVFFDQVMVMVEDEALKANRLQILCRLQSLLGGVADIACLSI